MGVSRYGRGRRRFTRRDALTREETTADGENEVLTALDGELAGKSLREIAEYLCGAERVSAEWSSESVLRARTRRLVLRARAHPRRTGLIGPRQHVGCEVPWPWREAIEGAWTCA